MVLPDVLRPGLDVVFCGTAAGKRSAEVGAYYAGPGNLFWSTLHAVGLTPRQLSPGEFTRLLDFNIGLTDACKTRSGSDRQVGEGAWDVARFTEVVELNAPRFVAFNSKKAAQAALGEKRPYGLQPDRLASSRLFVCPSTSGLARGNWDIALWHELADAIRAGAA